MAKRDFGEDVGAFSFYMLQFIIPNHSPAVIIPTSNTARTIAGAYCVYSW